MKMKMEDHHIIIDGGALPPLFFTFMLIWVFSALYWSFNTHKNRHFQANKLQWTLAAVPWIKALQLALSFLFWYSCFYTQVCSLWISFGVYITGVLFQTATIGCVFYLTLVGYRASVPYFSVLLLLNYLFVFYVIFNHVSQNLLVLRDQLSLIEDEDIQAMRDAVYTKYTMFRKFQGAMKIVVVTELAIIINMDNSIESYWMRLLVREWAQIFIFMYIGWIFRSQELAPRFSVMPALNSKWESSIPPIYSIEMDAETFKGFSSDEWHIGVPTSPSKGSLTDSVIVVIQHPHAYYRPAAKS